MNYQIKSIIVLMVFWIISLVSVSPAQLLTRAEYLKKFDEKSTELIDYFAASTYPGYTVAMARYHTRQGVEIADSMVIHISRDASGDMFWMMPSIACQVIGREVMSPAANAAQRQAWKTYAPARGDTENHWAMYYTALLIAAEQWPDLPGSEWYNGKSSAENFREAKEYLFDWAKLTTTKGQGEFDSPDYLIEYVMATIFLAQFAQDPETRRLGSLLTEYIFADFAVEHLNQLYGGGHSRIYESPLMHPEYGIAFNLAGLYFNAGEVHKSHWLVPLVISGYRLPEIIYQIATDRDQPYVHRERKRVRHNIRYGVEKNPPVYKYTYMTKDYVIGSLQGGLLQPIQQLTWSLKYNYGRPFSLIMGLHPYWSPYEIGTFFPSFDKICIAGIVSSKRSYNQPEKWTGGSPYERTFQHKNTLIALYDIPVGATSNHIDAFFPANLEERVVDESGWIFAKAGETYVGWFPLRPGEWSAEYEVKEPEFAAVTGSRENDGTQLLRNYRFRSWDLQNGYVVEVRSQVEVGSFENFQEKLRRHIPVANLQAGSVSVKYHTLNNEGMQFSFPEVRRLNGKVVDLAQTPLFVGPFLNAATDSQLLEISYKGKKRILDFKNLQVR